MPPFHLTGFAESQDPAGAFVNAAALADDLGFDDGDDFKVPDEWPNVVAIASLIPSGGNERARLVSPSLRRLNNYEIAPHNGGADAAAEPDSPHKVLDLRRIPLQLDPGEILNAEVDYNTTSAALGAVLLWLADGPIEPVQPAGVFTARFTAAKTLVAATWTNSGPLAITDELPVGRYQVVGMRAQAAGLVAARLVFGAQPNRPGVLGTDDVNDQEWEGWRNGGMGVFGEFESDRVPTIDFLSISADTAETVLLDLVQVRAGRG